MVAAYGPLARALCLALLTIGLLKGQAEPPAAEATPAESAIEVVIEAPESEDVDDAGVDAAGAQPLARDVPRHHEPPRLEPIRRVCRVTAYCDRGLTASGRRVGVGQCAAPPSIPFGSKVYIPALGRVSPSESRQSFRAEMQCRGERENGEVFLANVFFSTYNTAPGPRLARWRCATWSGWSRSGSAQTMPSCASGSPPAALASRCGEWRLAPRACTRGAAWYRPARRHPRPTPSFRDRAPLAWPGRGCRP